MLNESAETPATTEHDVVPAPGAGLELPAPVPDKQPRNQHLKSDDPKNKQFTARATETEAIRINACLQAQGGDIVRTFLKMMDYIEADVFQTFRTK